MSEKDSARRAIRTALKTGALTRPELCEECGQPGPLSSDGRSTIHAHHYEGYERPLSVVWLCPKCHFKEDARPSKENNGRAKLTMGFVQEIRSKYRPSKTKGGRGRKTSPNSTRGLALEYGVSQATVDRIVRNVNWIDEALK